MPATIELRERMSKVAETIVALRPVANTLRRLAVEGYANVSGLKLPDPNSREFTILCKLLGLDKYELLRRYSKIQASTSAWPIGESLFEYDDDIAFEREDKIYWRPAQLLDGTSGWISTNGLVRRELPANAMEAPHETFREHSGGHSPDEMMAWHAQPALPHEMERYFQHSESAFNAGYSPKPIKDWLRQYRMSNPPPKPVTAEQPPKMEKLPDAETTKADSSPEPRSETIGPRGLPTGERLGGDAPPVAAGSEPATVLGTDEDEGAGDVPSAPDGESAGPLSDDGGAGDAGTDGAGTGIERTAGATGLKPEPNPEAPHATAVDAVLSSPPAPETPTDLSAGNWRYQGRDWIKGGLKTKFRQNMDALRVAQQMQEEQRTVATPEEQATMSKFCGWGQFPALFNDYINADYNDDDRQRSAAQQRIDPTFKRSEWKDEQRALKELIGSDWRSAQASILNAHYTHPDIVDAHWAMARKLGFDGGRFLEPSAGIGYYLGQIPADIAARTAISAVEKETGTGEMLKSLYPSAHVQVKGFEESIIPDNFYDLIASNVPFGDWKLFEERYEKFDANIHDHFFLKSADACKPGGLVMHITSTGTMDNPNSTIRKELADKCELVAAYRFPGETHKENAGTSVVTDMVILRKKRPGEKPVSETETPSEAEPKRPGFSGVTTDSLGRVYHWKDGKRIPGPNWMDLTAVADPNGGEPIPVNKYWADNPQNVLGYHDRTGSMYGGQEKNVSRINAADLSAALGREVKFVQRDEQDETTQQATKKGSFLYADTNERVPNDVVEAEAEKQFKARLQDAIDRLPSGVFAPDRGSKAAFEPETSFPVPGDVMDGAYMLKDGKIFQRQGALMVPTTFKGKKLAKLVGMMGLRDIARQMFYEERTGQDSTATRAALNEAYDKFVKAEGFLNDPANIRLMVGDPDMFLVGGMEKWDATSKTATKAAMFEKSTVSKDAVVAKPEGVSDGMAISLNKLGRVDVGHIATLLGRDEAEVGRELVNKGIAFESPSEGWQGAAEYLSGNVRKKLLEAKAAAAVDPKYDANVKALEANQPPDKDREDIYVTIGAPWIPASDIQSFANELLGAAHASPFEVKYNHTNAEWYVSWKDARSQRLYEDRVESTETWGTKEKTLKDCLTAALNSKQLVVRGGTDEYTDNDGVVHEFEAVDDKGNNLVNQRETKAANAKVAEIAARFKDWIWEDQERGNRLERFYNDNLNDHVDTKWNGQHLDLPGMNPAYQAKLFPHIKDAIWRVVNRGTALLAHEMGMGKTTVMVGAAMELRRLGLAKKPMIACLKSNIEQITKEAAEMYPGARILSTAGAYSSEARQKIIARMATGDYDICLVTHDQLNRIKMRPEVQAKFINEEISELQAAKRRAQEAGKKGNRVVKDIEGKIQKLETALKKSLNPNKKDQAMFFEDLGVDQLFVDECFPGRTMVDTDRGPMTIGEIVDNRLCVKVLSCNRETHKLEYMPVISWFKRPLRNHLVKVRHEHGEFICTPNHNIWTEEDGYVQAGLLQGNHTLRVVPKGVCSEQTPEGVLLEGVFGKSTLATQGVSGKNCSSYAGRPERSKPESVVGENDETQSDVRSSDSREGEAISAWEAILASGRQREGAPGTTAATGMRPGVDDGILRPDSTGKIAVSENPKLLQGGHSASGTEDSNRSGRPVASGDDWQTTGCTQDGSSIASRMVSVAIYQRAGDERTFDGDDGDSFVYDIEVSGNHNYFADGVNVSNSHQFKSLPAITSMGRVKGIATNRSQRATDMLMRVRWLRENNGGRGVVFASGTPVSNTLGELYTMQRYLQPEKLRERGIDNFDAWARTFATPEMRYEVNVAGELKPVSRLASFGNTDELRSIAGDVIDTKFTEQAIDKEGKQAIVRPVRHDSVIAAPNSKTMQDFMQSLVDRVEALQKEGFQNKKGGDNMLVIGTDGRKGAVDMRLLDDNAPDDPNSKLNHCVRNVLETWKKYPDKTQVIFSDIGVNPQKQKQVESPDGELQFDGTGESLEEPEEDDDLDSILKGDVLSGKAGVNLGSNGRFRMYDDIIDKLVKGGIPREKIADFAKLKGVERQNAIDDLRAGKMLIGIGSRGRLGTGCNVQDNLKAIHHLDVPYVPAAVEQADARGWRHGNKNKDIEITRYVTKGSLDEKFWDIIDFKTKFKNQFFRGEKTGRAFTDDDSETLTPEVISAYASGDSRRLTKAKLGQEVDELRAAKRRHQRTLERYGTELKKYDEWLPKYRAQLESLSKDSAHLSSEENKKFSYTTAGGEKLTRAQAEERIPDDIATHVNEWNRGGRRSWEAPEPVTVGEYRGVKLVASPKFNVLKGKGEWEADLHLVGPSGEKYGTSPKLGSVEYVADLIKFDHYSLANQIKQAEARREELAAKVPSPVFKDDETLKQKESELKRLTDELTGESRPKAEPEKEALTGREFSPSIKSVRVTPEKVTDEFRKSESGWATNERFMLRLPQEEHASLDSEGQLNQDAVDRYTKNMPYESPVELVGAKKDKETGMSMWAYRAPSGIHAAYNAGYVKAITERHPNARPFMGDDNILALKDEDGVVVGVVMPMKDEEVRIARGAPVGESLTGIGWLDYLLAGGEVHEAHAPKGFTHDRPLTMNGKSYIGGQFIPGATQSQVNIAAARQNGGGGVAPQPAVNRQPVRSQNQSQANAGASQQPLPPRDNPQKGMYVAAAMDNLARTSRTAAGTVDKTASVGKSDKMADVSGEQAAEQAKKNYESVMGHIFDNRYADLTDEKKVGELLDNINRSINHGITKEGVLLRTDDGKWPYVKAEHLDVARKQFAKELTQRLNDPSADPIDTAAWAEWRINIDHAYADGCGKTQRAVAALILMRHNLPLPNYQDPKKTFKFFPKTAPDPRQGGSAYLGHAFEKWRSYYRMRVPAYGTSSVRAVERKYPVANATGVDAKDRHSKDGKYTPTRTRLHNSIVSHFRGTVPVVNSGPKIFHMMGGGPASGKSSVVRAGLVSIPDGVKIDSDEIKKKLPEFQSLMRANDMRAADYVHEESSDVAKRVMAESLGAGQHVLLDGTGDSSLESIKKKADLAREHGYKVHASYTTCSTDEAIRRNVVRAYGAEKAKAMGHRVTEADYKVKPEGRLPPEDMLRDVHASVSKVVPEAIAAGLYDHVTLHDTEHVGDDGKPRLVMSAVGSRMTIHDHDAWKRFLEKAAERS